MSRERYLFKELGGNLATTFHSRFMSSGHEGNLGGSTRRCKRDSFNTILPLYFTASPLAGGKQAQTSLEGKEEEGIDDEGPAMVISLWKRGAKYLFPLPNELASTMWNTDSELKLNYLIIF